MKYEPLSGTRIETACKEACALAMNHGKDVSFDFNEIILTATPKTRPCDLAKEYDRQCNKRSEDYKKSPEGIAAAEKRTSEIIEKQVRLYGLEATLCDVLSDEKIEGHLAWLKQYTKLADDIGVSKDLPFVVDYLKADGYENNQHAGNPPDWFNTKQRMGEYIFGQAINYMEDGMPPHPITLSFIDNALALP